MSGEVTGINWKVRKGMIAIVLSVPWAYNTVGGTFKPEYFLLWKEKIFQLENMIFDASTSKDIYVLLMHGLHNGAQQGFARCTYRSNRTCDFLKFEYDLPEWSKWFVKKLSHFLRNGILHMMMTPYGQGFARLAFENEEQNEVITLETINNYITKIKVYWEIHETVYALLRLRSVPVTASSTGISPPKATSIVQSTKNFDDAVKVGTKRKINMMSTSICAIEDVPIKMPHRKTLVSKK
jgi:hypothetical protein